MAEPGNQEGGTTNQNLRTRRRRSALPGVPLSHFRKSAGQPHSSPARSKKITMNRRVFGFGALAVAADQGIRSQMKTETYQGGVLAKPNTTPSPFPEKTPTPPPVPAPRPESATPTPIDRSMVVPHTPDWLVPILRNAAKNEKNEEDKELVNILSAIAQHETGGTFDPRTKEKDSNGQGRGLYQIDLGYHSEITEEQAFDPVFSSKKVAEWLLLDYNNLGKSWEKAIKAHNAGYDFDNPDKIGYKGKKVKDLAENYYQSVKRIREGKA